jgi:outer membrane biosynthesis protein TonB
VKFTMLATIVFGCAVFAGAQNDASAPSGSQTDHPQTVQVSAAALSGMVEHKTLPQYPKEALLKGIQGDVVFKVVVDENGKIVRSEPIGGDPLLVAASKDALQGYRFHPYLLNGTPVAFKSELGYHFVLSRKGDATAGTVECMSTVP